jgi:autotransporter-associated beta strand protein
MSAHPSTFRAVFPLRSSAVPISMAAAMFTQLAPDASASEYIWTQTAGGAQNWTDGTNWDGGSAPTPASGDTVDFSTVDILANTTLTLGANRTATTWRFGDTDGGQTWTVTGNTLTLAGSGATIEVGTATSISSVFSVSNGTTATATGNGALTLTNASFVIGGTSGTQTQTLDLTGLDGDFTYDNSGGTFQVSGKNTGSSGASSGILSLASTSEITALSLGVGNSAGGANNASTSLNYGTVNLGTTDTTINANTITLGNNKAQGSVQYASGGGATDPELTLRGSDGTSRVTTITIGVNGTNEYATNSTWNLASNVSGTSQLDAMIDTLVVGESNRTAGTATSASVTGNFLMGGGTLDATTIVLGRTVTNTRMLNTTGTFTTGAGGTVKVGTLTIGDKNATENKTVIATFNLNGGADLHATTIQAGNTAANGTVNRNFNWNDGTIHNLAGTDLAISAGVTWTLASTGTHAFDIDNGRVGTVDALLGGTGGTLNKTGEGTLTLSGANTYSGATSVDEGTLLIEGPQTGAGNITVEHSGRLGGNGSAANAAVIVNTGGGLSINIADWTGEAGTGFSDLDVQSLDLPDGAWVIDVASATTYANFSETPATFPFLITSSGIDGFNADNLTVTAGDAFPGSGTWAVQVNGNTLELSYSPGAGSDYSDWAASYEEYDLSDPQADLDGDGLTNWQEYAFGLDPTSGASVNPILSIADLKTLGQFTYTRRYNSGLTYSVYTSTDLNTWYGPVAVIEDAGAPVDGVQTVLVELNEIPVEDTLFIRVKAD